MDGSSKVTIQTVSNRKVVKGPSNQVGYLSKLSQGNRDQQELSPKQTDSTTT